MAKPAPLPSDEIDRIGALMEQELLDTDDEDVFDGITNLAKRLFKVPIVLVSLVDVKRQWFKSCIGLPVKETHRDLAFCAYAILKDEPFIVPDASKDERFNTNPLVTGDPFIRFYAGAPLITSDGYALGTLCLIDRVPRIFTKEESDRLVRYATSVVSAIEMRKAVKEALEAIKDEDEAE